MKKKNALDAAIYESICELCKAEATQPCKSRNGKDVYDTHMVRVAAGHRRLKEEAKSQHE